MRFFSPFLVLQLFVVCAALSGSATASSLKLWYSAPGTSHLSQGLLIGNGRMGGIVMGGVASEEIVLNDSSLWTGGANTGGAYGSMGSYQYFGSLGITLPGQTTSSNYRRELDLGDGMARVSYDSGGVSYSREYFTSAPDQVMVVSLLREFGRGLHGFAGFHRYAWGDRHRCG